MKVSTTRRHILKGISAAIAAPPYSSTRKLMLQIQKLRWVLSALKPGHWQALAKQMSSL